VQEGQKRSRLLVPLVLLIAAAIVVAGAFELANQSSSAPSAASGSSTTQVGSAWNRHIDILEAMNITTLEADYTPNATLSFVSMGVGDYYEPNSQHVTYDNVTTPKQIGVFFQGTFLSDFILPRVYDSNMTVSVQGNTAFVTSSFTLSGTNLDYSNLIASVTCHVTYVKQGQQWLISHETWTLNNINSH